MKLRDYLLEGTIPWEKDRKMVVKTRSGNAVLYVDKRVRDMGYKNSVEVEIDPTESRGVDVDDIIRAFNQDRAFKTHFTEEFEKVIKTGFKEIKEINKPGKNQLQVVFT